MHLKILLLSMISPLAVLAAPVPFTSSITFAPLPSLQGQPPASRFSEDSHKKILAAFETAQDSLKGMKVAYDRAHEYDLAERNRRPLPPVGKEERDNLLMAFGRPSWYAPTRHASVNAIFQALTTGTLRIYDASSASATSYHQALHNGDRGSRAYAMTRLRHANGAADPILLMPLFYGDYKNGPTIPALHETELTIKRALVLIHESLHLLLSKTDAYVGNGSTYRMLLWNQVQQAVGARTIQAGGYNTQTGYFDDWSSEAQIASDYKRVRDNCANMWDSPDAWGIFGSLYWKNIYPLRRPRHSVRPPR